MGGDGVSMQHAAQGGNDVSDNRRRGLIILLPSYTSARHFLRILDGVSYPLYRSTFDAIWEQRGSHQEQVSWGYPDTWIADRLSGEERALAQRVWDASKHELNPRYLRPPWRMTTKHDLLVWGARDVLQVTERGRRFLDDPQGRVVAEIDRYEGVLTLLQIVAELGPAKRGDFLTSFTSFCTAVTTSRGSSAISTALSRRLRNLMERGYVLVGSQIYEITQGGLQYLERYENPALGRLS